jgi:electron transport complex protein RnfD
MRFQASVAPHVLAGCSVPRVMLQVLAAMLPVAVVQAALYGPGLLLQLAVAVPTALACEALAMRLRRRAAAPALLDGSVLVTAALVAVSVTPFAPWWLTVGGTAVGVLVGKHAFGGLGHNPFNPAMVGYAAMLVSFPFAMSRWPVPLDGGATWSALAVQSWAAFCDAAPPARFDAWTGATALDALRSGLALRYTMEEITSGTEFGGLAGAGSQWVNLAALAGGAFLLARRIVRWQIPLAMLAGIAAPAALMHTIDPGVYPGPLFECFAGAAMLGAFFIATDPVTAATSDRGRLVYGAGIGLLTWAIRHWGSYPDGVAFSVLTMNLAAPLIDRWTIPRIHGDRH